MRERELGIIKDESWIEGNVIIISQKDRKIKKIEQLGEYGRGNMQIAKPPTLNKIYVIKKRWWKWTYMWMQDVLHVPDLHSNLLPFEGFEGAFQFVGMHCEGQQRRDVGRSVVEIQFAPIGYQRGKWSRNEFFCTFRWKFAFFGALTQEVGSSQRQ